MSYFACLLSVVSFFVVFVSDNFDVTFISDVFLARFHSLFTMFESYTSANATCDINANC